MDCVKPMLRMLQNDSNEIFDLYCQTDTGTSSNSRFVRGGHDDKEKEGINGIFPSRDRGPGLGVAGRLPGPSLLRRLSPSQGL